MATNNAINANSTTPLPIVDGGTGVNAVTTAPTASAFAGWDANSNLSMNNAIEGYTTTATAAGTTVLTVASTYQQFFTGSTTQTVTMPVTSTLVLGQSWLIVNKSSGVVTVQSSGGNTIVAMAANTDAIITCILTSGTSAASWNSDYSLNALGVSSITGTANQVIASASTGDVTLSLPQSIATSSNVQFGSVAFSTTSGIIGTTTNDNAAAGSVGELLSATNTAGTALTTGANADVVSLSLTAGDWDIQGGITYVASVSMSITVAGFSTTSVTLPTDAFQLTYLTGAFGTIISQPVQWQRLSLASTTTVYLVAAATFPGTCSAYGSIYARRRR